MNIIRTTSLTTVFFITGLLTAFSQSTSSDTLTGQKHSGTTHSYPEIKGYTGIVLPIYTISNDGDTWNFQNNVVIGNPWGINLWKSKKFGYSFEFTPLLKINSTESKVATLLFHPGVLYRIGHEYTLIGRVAYETSGRYGFTPILNKVVKRTASNTFFIAVLFPVRFGNGHAPTYTAAFQFGIGF